MPPWLIFRIMLRLAKGDTIVTSGFGGVFPEGYLIGTIDDFRLKGGNYYEIRVKLSTDFRKLELCAGDQELMQEMKLIHLKMSVSQ